MEDKTSSSSPLSPITENFGKLEEEVAEVSPIEMEIIQSAPKNLKQKASLLMQRLKMDHNIGWNSRGELIYKGEVVPHTHIHDLVQDVLRKRKTHTPHGWKTFAKALKESHIPKDLIGNQDHWEWMQQEPVIAKGEHWVENLAATSSANDIYETKMKSKSSRQQLHWTPYK